MNKFNFQQTGGFPFDTDVLHDMQEAYTIFNALGAIAGDKTIISGCVENGNNVSDGYIYVGGELFPFKGGSKSTTIVLIEENTNETFEDGVNKNILKKRHYQFGSGINALNWNDFKRFDVLASLTERLRNLENKTNLQVLATGSEVSDSSFQDESNSVFIVTHPPVDVESTTILYSIGRTRGTSSPVLSTPAAGHYILDRHSEGFRLHYSNVLGVGGSGGLVSHVKLDWLIVKK